MGKINTPSPVKFFIGIFFEKISVFEEAKKELVDIYGPIDLETENIPFDFTSYYEKEMGVSLWRKFISFENLIDPQYLKDIKIQTNFLEEKMAGRHSPPERPINIDPGYLSLSKVILATTKDYSHRIYLGEGIYAEVTLCYIKKQFQDQSWTFPDYKTEIYKSFFYELRSIYKKQLQDRN